MSSRRHPPMRPSQLHLVWIVLGAAAGAFACSKDNNKQDAWNCTMVPVPGGGEAVECVSKETTALTSSVYVGTDTTSDGTDNNFPPTEPYLSSLIAVFVGGGTTDGAIP